MKKDKLNIDSFTTREGKNYRQAMALDKTKIKAYFSKKGYRVIDLRQIWRHVHGKLEKDGRLFFLKMASTSDIGERTRNETFWNLDIGEKIKKYEIDYFGVPQIYETGECDGKFYYLASYHDGPLLATSNPPDIKNLDQWLEKIIKTNLFLLSIPDSGLHFRGSRDSFGTQEKWDDYFRRIRSWYEEVAGHDLGEILKETQDLTKTYESGINHGDFVPWHMISDDRKFILIDAEHASTVSPKFYDICYFYHRLFTKAQSPDLAKIYLGRLRDRLPEPERNKFDLSIRPILAVRIIGGYWDAKTDGADDTTYHDRLKNDFLKNELY